MGLDNGLMVRAKTIKGARFLEQNYANIKDDCFANSYEFGYWRKCWNIRHKVLNTFKNKGYDGMGGDLILNIADLVTFRDIMKYFLIEENWRNSDYGSIWSWEESISGIAKTIYWITQFLEDVEYEGLSDTDFEIYFYDSY